MLRLEVASVFLGSVTVRFFCAQTAVKSVSYVEGSGFRRWRFSSDSMNSEDGELARMGRLRSDMPATSA